MYFPKRFRLAHAVEYAELVGLAYGQRHAAQEGTPWSLPPRLSLLRELGYPSKSLGAMTTVPAGFVARRGRTVYVVFRGTETPEEWVKNLKIKLVPYEGYGNVHSGFLERTPFFQQQIAEALEGVRADVVCVGHSLGASYATFAAIEIERTLKKRVAALYTYASPRIGDGAFADAFNREFEHRAFRIVNTSDVVPSLPPPCPVFALGGYFSHGGTPVDFTVQLNGIRDNHRIETYRAELARVRKNRWWWS